jgi:cardiolipin synthase
VKLKYIPNLICIARILLVAPIVWSLLEDDYGLALFLVLTAGLSDALDGYLARRFDWRTRLGGLLDPAADKLLMLSLFVTLSWLGWVPTWFTAIVIGRDVIIVAGIVAYQALVEPVRGNPTPASKLNTVLQIVFALLVIAHAWRGWPPVLWLEMLGATVLVTIIVSVTQYIATGISALKEARRTER